MTGQDGTLIFSGINEDADGNNDQYQWNVDKLDAGNYYIYAIIQDSLTSITVYNTAMITKLLDTDGDGVADRDDNCTNIANAVDMLTNHAWDNTCKEHQKKKKSVVETPKDYCLVYDKCFQTFVLSPIQQ